MFSVPPRLVEPLATAGAVVGAAAGAVVGAAAGAAVGAAAGAIVGLAAPAGAVVGAEDPAGADGAGPQLATKIPPASANASLSSIRRVFIFPHLLLIKVALLAEYSGRQR